MSATRIDARCPICQEETEQMLALEFSEHAWLPHRLSLALCNACDFAFTTPANADSYAKYYAETTNDQLAGDDPSSDGWIRYETQAGFLAPVLARQTPKRVLDMGCGSGGLLHTLQKCFGQHHYHGVDPNAVAQSTPEGISFSPDWPQPEETFDLIIVSHALEHMVDLDTFSRICQFLAPDGVLYIEVPDATRYADFPRREYLYYIDRLHVNHFTSSSLWRLMARWGLSVTWFGQHDFLYKDQGSYPSCCILATAAVMADSTPPDAVPLTVALKQYLKGESLRAAAWRQCLDDYSDILVYGFGDNFFRCVHENGPLAGCNIQAVIDRRWQALGESRYASEYHFIDLDYALKHHADLPVVVTLSWGAEAVAQTLTTAGFRRIFIV